MCALLAKRVLWQVYALPPILRVQPLLHAAVKGRVRPFTCSVYQAVLHRVEVDVIHVLREIRFVPDLMLPKAPLSQRRFMLLVLRRRRCRQRTHLRPAGFGHLAFDDAPALAKVSVVLRQRPDGVHVVGQHHPSVNCERQGVPRVLNSAAQRGKDVRLAQQGPPVLRHHREKVRSASGV